MEKVHKVVKQYRRKGRKEKIFIPGAARAGTTLVHKCLLVSGLVNWGPWHLHIYDSEAKVRGNMWRSYPNIKPLYVKPKNFFEIAKSPDLSLSMDKLMEIYPNSKYIIFERDIEERIPSFIGGFGKDLYDNLINYPNMMGAFEQELGEYPKDNETLLRGYFMLLQRLREEALQDYDHSLILRVDFHKLMNDWDKEMTKVCEFVEGIEYEYYKPVWDVIRTMKMIPTASDVKSYIIA
jgi:hypothetical protein